jgi:hypothetical protein
MHRFSLFVACAILVSGASCLTGGCGRKPVDDPLVAAEKVQWVSAGWEFVAVVGAPRGNVETREVRFTDPQTGKLTVIAPASGLPGESRGPEESRTFQERDYQFLEVKIMTSPADGYSIVFRRKIRH